MTETAIRIKCDLCENASPSALFANFSQSGVSIQPARAMGLDTGFKYVLFILQIGIPRAHQKITHPEMIYEIKYFRK